MRTIECHAVPFPKTKIYFQEGTDPVCYWNRPVWYVPKKQRTTGSVYTAKPHSIVVDPMRKHWEMELAHEVGHVIANGIVDMAYAFNNDAYMYEVEYLAWRIAKSMIKPSLWNEAHAIRCLDSYLWPLGILYSNRYSEIKEYKGGEKNEKLLRKE